MKILSKFQVSSANGLGVKVSFYRTAPTTPGLLNIEFNLTAGQVKVYGIYLEVGLESGAQ